MHSYNWVALPLAAAVALPMQGGPYFQKRDSKVYKCIFILFLTERVNVCAIACQSATNVGSMFECYSQREKAYIRECAP